MVKNDNSSIENDHKIINIISIMIIIISAAFCIPISIITANTTLIGVAIVLLLLFSIIIVFESYNVRQMHNESIFEKLIKSLASNYIIKSFDEEFTDEELIDENIKKYTKMDAESFSCYDEAIEDDIDTISQNDVNIKDIERFIKRDSKDNETKNVYFYAFYETYSDTSYINSDKSINYNIILSEINSRKRLHIKIKDKAFKEIKKLSFEEVFEDYKDTVKIMDEKFSESYPDYYLNEYHKKPYYIDKDSEYVELSESQKERFMEVFEKYGIHFSVVMQSGVARIKTSYIPSNIDEDKYLNEITNTLVELLDIVEKID